MRNKILVILFSVVFLFSCSSGKKEPIDRFSLVNRNNVVVTNFDSLSSLSVGNGNFAFTVDPTGLQSFPEIYENGVCLGTQSQWGWHSFPNKKKFNHNETLKEYNFHNKKELYSVEFKKKGRQHDAANYFRENPHRLHLGIIGFDFFDKSGNKLDVSAVKNSNQKLDLWNGCINSSFKLDNKDVNVKTACSSDKDEVICNVKTSLFKDKEMAIKFRFPYPTGRHADDACDWTDAGKHVTKIISKNANSVLLERILDNDKYYVSVKWEGRAEFSEKAKHYFILEPMTDDFSFVCEFSKEKSEPDTVKVSEDFSRSSEYWNSFWKSGGAVDFSKCKDPRAKELERRVVLSQYLTAIQCSGIYPPQETGLVYNSWFGKFHLEMHWWHAAHFALWGRPDLLDKSLGWYFQAEPVARQIAERQGFRGVRWMKMTDPSAMEAPSKVGSFLIWQQPHIIYMTELLYRINKDSSILRKYKDLVFETADFIADFATYDSVNDRYIIKGVIPAQETLSASRTINPPLELSYWHFALEVANKWRQRLGLKQDKHWKEVADKLSPLAQKDGLYLAAESAPETYSDIKYTSDHMAVLGAVGMLPDSRLVDDGIMRNTLDWVIKNWNWNKTWGWDFPMTAMCAARLGRPEEAVNALLLKQRTNTYLVNGHNYQTERLRIYLPGNGGLLSAVSMMCAGWDGSKGDCPGFPKDGNWDVKWEGLYPMP